MPSSSSTVTAAAEKEGKQKLIKLRSSDDGLFEVKLEVALQSQTIKDMVEELIDCDSSTTTIPLPNVSSKVLAKVLEFCHHHHQHPAVTVRIPAPTPDANIKSSEEDLKQWNAEFLHDLDKDALFDLILAANYLNIANLLDVACQRVADMIQALKTPEEVRKVFGIENDFTPEEEEEVRKENRWTVLDDELHEELWGS